jgi:Histidine kinase-, DNA gyrase B-, and HSP90-like ATPase
VQQAEGGDVMVHGEPLTSAHEDFEIVAPDAGAMIESMRAFGYDLPTAIADLLDNSISAKARNIWVDFIWSGTESRILVRDDGKGMDEKELVVAMRMGSISPIAEREKSDLGRFGLGLKTASFSQARRLTVISKAKGCAVEARCWDLDYVAGSGHGEWRLLKAPELLASEVAQPLADQPSGTIVVLNKLDRVVGEAALDDSRAQKRFRERVDQVRQHLGMVFHRFLRGSQALAIHINGALVEAWDPFLSGQSDKLAEERLQCEGSDVAVVPYVLPHHSRITSEEHREAAGPKGWNAQQGFYVYRNKRLIVAGDWLGLGIQKEEHYKLARLKVDIPNTLDEAWHLDVRKAKAHPPSAIRDDLKRIARATREKAANVYRHRGKVLQRKHADDFVFVWSPKVFRGKTYYKINREHPLVKAVRSICEDVQRFGSLLSLIEQSVPSPLIVIRNSEQPDALGQPFGDDSKALLQSMEHVFAALLEQGLTKQEAAGRIAVMDPYTHYPEVLSAFLDQEARK